MFLLLTRKAVEVAGHDKGKTLTRTKCDLGSFPLWNPTPLGSVSSALGKPRLPLHRDEPPGKDNIKASPSWGVSLPVVYT